MIVVSLFVVCITPKYGLSLFKSKNTYGFIEPYFTNDRKRKYYPKRNLMRK